MKPVGFRAVSTALFLLSAGTFLVCAALKAASSTWPQAVTTLAAPLCVYVLAHAFRAARLGVLLGAGQARRLLGLYFYTAAASAVIPFKLGELVKINEIAAWCGSYWRGLLVVWMERVFDVVALGSMALFILAGGAQEPGDLRVLLAAMGVFVFLTVFFLFIAPAQLDSLNLHVMRNYRGRKAVFILRALDSFHQLLDHVQPLLKGKAVTLALLTVLIWSAELGAIWMLLHPPSFTGSATALVRQFSSVLSAGAPSLGEPAGFNDAKTLLLIAIGLVALTFYARSRTMGRRIHAQP